MRNLSYENEYDLHSNGLVSKTHFHMKGFALGLVLKQRQKRTRKWPIRSISTTRTVVRAQCNWLPRDGCEYPGVIYSSFVFGSVYCVC